MQELQHDLFPVNPGEKFLTGKEWEIVAELFHFSPRELQVAILICDGETRQGIAQILGLNLGTIRGYIDRIFLKLAVHNKVAMVVRILRFLEVLKSQSEAM